MKELLWKCNFTFIYCTEEASVNFYKGWKLASIALKEYGYACDPDHAYQAIIERV